MTEYIRFDWAMKKLLRNKASFIVFEGFISALLNKKVVVKNMLESEGNVGDNMEKNNRLDLLATDENGELIIIEIQNNTEMAYFQRMLFATSKLVTDYINKGDSYDKIKKIYSINIVYFNLGNGTDYIYHGKTEFKGIHNGELLNLSPFQRQKFKVDAISKLYPEYYILKVNEFNKVAKTPLEEWIYYFKTGEISDKTTTPGLPEAKEQMLLNSMTRDERRQYERYLVDKMLVGSSIEDSREEGRFEGRILGMEEGRAEGRIEGRAEGRAEGEKKVKAQIAKQMKADGLSTDIIKKYTGINPNNI